MEDVGFQDSAWSHYSTLLDAERLQNLYTFSNNSQYEAVADLMQ